MRTPILTAVFAACLGVSGCASLNAGSASIAARLAAQNALFEEQDQSDMKAHPELATSYGDYRYNDRLDEYSLAAISDEHARDEAFLARLQTISTAGFPEQDTLSHQLMLHILQQRARNYQFKEYEMPVSQMAGPCVELADLPLAVPFDSVQQYEDYIARLHQIPRVFAQTEEVLRTGMKDHLMPVRFLLEKCPSSARGSSRLTHSCSPPEDFPPASLRKSSNASPPRSTRSSSTKYCPRTGPSAVSWPMTMRRTAARRSRSRRCRGASSAI
jgi:uncharacterized protein (DUF885 family)